LAQAGKNLRDVAEYLLEVAERTGHEIVLAIEPEPGCVLDTAPDIIRFLERYVFSGPNSEIVRRHITVCHDICHSAVMFEPQAYALGCYAEHGIRIGKVQVSSAIEVPWHEVASEERRAAWSQLLSFNEPRYLHQTTRQSPLNDQVEMLDDLPEALLQWLPHPNQHGQPTNSANPIVGEPECSDKWPKQPWRIHFHVPIYIDRFGLLRATRDDISQVVHSLRDHSELRIAGRPWFTGDYEVETYAWSVLPPELMTTNLAQGIAQELTYFQSVLLRRPAPGARYPAPGADSF
jgi:hypothetical protein